MIDLNYLWKGALVGFVAAIPVGPIAILCMRRTLYYGRWSGFFSGLGAAFADALFSAIAIFGLTLVSDFLLQHHFWLRVAGGAFLVFLGARSFSSKPHLRKEEVTHKTLLGDFFSTFFLTLTNPLTLLSFIALFGGAGLAGIASQHFDALSLVTGVLLGSAIWWLLLSEGIACFRGRLSEAVMLWANRTAGVLIALFGVAIWISIL